MKLKILPEALLELDRFGVKMIEGSRRTGALRRFASDDAVQSTVEEEAGRLRDSGQARHGHFYFETV